MVQSQPSVQKEMVVINFFIGNFGVWFRILLIADMFYKYDRLE